MPHDLVTVTVDGKTTQVPKGENLLKVIKSLKIKVPHYCYHAGLSIAGACRMCMVEIEKVPRPVIACNTTVTDGMVVKTQTDQIKSIQKWNLEFHLINHPLDCPICDQAGECKLQDYYMKYGKYTSAMQEPKVLKRKVISIGKHVMLDTERCILCSRCVRFFDEVPKTSEMAIFKRGDRSEIGTYEDRELNNNYTLNSVDICPVGALTSKDFRFQKRVWFLKEVKSVCPGCSTGCNVSVHEDPREKKAFRMLPRFNAAVNQYWMCDYGRMCYKQTHREVRILTPHQKISGELKPVSWEEARIDLLNAFKTAPHKMGILITPQYTTEEFETIYQFFITHLKTKDIYHSADPIKASDQTVTDELLLRPDKNPNANGLLQVSKKYGLESNALSVFQQKLVQNQWTTLFIFSPGDPESEPHFLDWFDKRPFALEKMILFGTQNRYLTPLFDLIIPTLSFVEKTGIFTNVFGHPQKIEAGVQLVDEAKALPEILCL